MRMSAIGGRFGGEGASLTLRAQRLRRLIARTERILNFLHARLLDQSRPHPKRKPE
jgi:hypothetical protein